MNYFEMYKVIWDFHKKHIDGDFESDAFWTDVLDEAGQIAKKYENNDFITNLLMNELNEIDKIARHAKAV